MLQTCPATVPFLHTIHRASRYLATSAAECVLLRDFIQTSLYDPVHGYFSQQRPPVGKLPRGIDFKKLTGELEYKMKLQALYKELQTSWLTPAEIFAPHYGNAIARYLLEHHRHNLKGEGEICILEVGGGRGTLANNIMDYIKRKSPALYKGMRYTCVEISPVLSALQRGAAQDAGHAAHFQSVTGDATEGNTWTPCATSDHAFVLMMEVLDNLPHDRIVRSSRKGPWSQTLVCKEQSPAGIRYQERIELASDHLIQRLIDAGVVDALVVQDSLVERIAAMAAGIDKLIWGTGEEVVFIPTRCLEFLDTLQSKLPNHTLIAADFDALPDMRIRGINAPLVSCTRDGRNHDWDTIYVPPGMADIFFPTNFKALEKIYHHSVQFAQTGRTVIEAKHVSSQEFMLRLADLPQTSTLSGYNPLLQDYMNTRFFIASSRQATKR